MNNGSLKLMSIYIDVIIATFNRAALIDRAVRSILNSRRRPEFDFAITVVDNNSSDNTPQVVARLNQESKGKVHYLFEPRQGKSFAVNAGITATKGDVIALADDDQIMGDEWLDAICQAFTDGYDFVTGPVYGDWLIEPPAWYSDRLHGVLSLFNGGDERVAIEVEDSKYGFSGGNGAIRRSVMERIGGYHNKLGKITGKFTMCEDGELFIRLKRGGYSGIYEPRMKVFHLIPRERMTRSYFRHWHLGYGRSMALIDMLHPKPVSYWFGVPRFLLRQTIKAVPRMIRARSSGDTPGVFEQELKLWFILGFIGGKLSRSSPAPPPTLSQDRVISGRTRQKGLQTFIK